MHENTEIKALHKQYNGTLKVTMLKIVGIFYVINICFISRNFFFIEIPNRGHSYVSMTIAPLLKDFNQNFCVVDTTARLCRITPIKRI